MGMRPFLFLHSLLAAALASSAISSLITTLNSNLDTSKSIQTIRSIERQSLNLLEIGKAQDVLNDLMNVKLEGPASVAQRITCRRIAEDHDLPQETCPGFTPEDLNELFLYMNAEVYELKEEDREFMVVVLRQLLKWFSPSPDLKLPSMEYWRLPRSIPRIVASKYGTFLPHEIVHRWIILLIKGERWNLTLLKLLDLLSDASWDKDQKSSLIVDILAELFSRRMETMSSLRFSVSVLLKLHEINIGLDQETLWREAGARSHDGDGEAYLLAAGGLLPLFASKFPVPLPNDTFFSSREIPLMNHIYAMEALFSVSMIHKLPNYRERIVDLSKRLLMISAKGTARRQLERKGQEEVFKYIWHADAFRVLKALITVENSLFNRRFFQEFSWFRMGCRPNSAIILHSAFFLKLSLGGLCDSIQKLRLVTRNALRDYPTCLKDAPFLAPNVYTFDLAKLGKVNKPEDALVLMKALLLFMFGIPLEFTDITQATMEDLDFRDVEFIADLLVDRHCQLHRQSRANVKFELKS